MNTGLLSPYPRHLAIMLCCQILDIYKCYSVNTTFQLVNKSATLKGKERPFPRRLKINYFFLRVQAPSLFHPCRKAQIFGQPLIFKVWSFRAHKTSITVQEGFSSTSTKSKVEAYIGCDQKPLVRVSTSCLFPDQ